MAGDGHRTPTAPLHHGKRHLSAEEEERGDEGVQAVAGTSSMRTIPRASSAVAALRVLPLSARRRHQVAACTQQHRPSGREQSNMSSMQWHIVPI